MKRVLALLEEAAALCSNARVLALSDGNPRYTVLGYSTEACLNVVAEKAGIDLTENETWAQRVKELPFDSSRKRMTTVHRLKQPVNGSSFISITKGAPKETSELCNKVYENGQLRDLTDTDREAILAANDDYARQGLRVLAVAYRNLEEVADLPKALSDYSPEVIEEDMVFQGLVVMADPPREEVAAAVELCRKAAFVLSWLQEIMV